MDAQKRTRANELMVELASLLADAENPGGSWTTLDRMELAANEVGGGIQKVQGHSKEGHSKGPGAELINRGTLKTPQTHKTAPDLFLRVRRLIPPSGARSFCWVHGDESLIHFTFDRARSESMQTGCATHRQSITTNHPLMTPLDLISSPLLAAPAFW